MFSQCKQQRPSYLTTFTTQCQMLYICNLATAGYYKCFKSSDIPPKWRGGLQTYPQGKNRLHRTPYDTNARYLKVLPLLQNHKIIKTLIKEKYGCQNR